MEKEADNDKRNISRGVGLTHDQFWGKQNCNTLQGSQQGNVFTCLLALKLLDKVGDDLKTAKLVWPIFEVDFYLVQRLNGFFHWIDQKLNIELSRIEVMPLCSSNHFEQLDFLGLLSPIKKYSVESCGLLREPSGAVQLDPV